VVCTSFSPLFLVFISNNTVNRRVASFDNLLFFFLLLPRWISGMTFHPLRPFRMRMPWGGWTNDRVFKRMIHSRSRTATVGLEELHTTFTACHRKILSCPQTMKRSVTMLLMFLRFRMIPCTASRIGYLPHPSKKNSTGRPSCHPRKLWSPSKSIIPTTTRNRRHRNGSNCHYGIRRQWDLPVQHSLRWVIIHATPCSWRILPKRLLIQHFDRVITLGTWVGPRKRP